MVNVFKTYHPAVAFAYLACAIVFTMAAMHPAYVVLSLAGALACSCVTRGVRETVRSLAWVVPLCAVVALTNPLFNSMGATELVRFGGFVVRGESLAYGLCAGGMLAAVFLWFSAYSASLDSEGSMALFARALPTVTFMVSHVLRLVPQFIARGAAVAAVQDATSAAAPRSKREAAAGRLRIVSVLAGWGMEDAIERSNAMRARGYGCGVRRTTYRRFAFGAADAAVVAVTLVLTCAAAVAAVGQIGAFSFYPMITEPIWQAACIPYAALMALPVFLQAKEWLLWKSCR